MLEFQILLVESPIAVSTNTNLVDSPIGVFTGRKSNQGDLDSPTAHNLDEETVLQDLHAETNNRAVVTENGAAQT